MPFYTDPSWLCPLALTVWSQNKAYILPIQVFLLQKIVGIDQVFFFFFKSLRKLIRYWGMS